MVRDFIKEARLMACKSRVMLLFRYTRHLEDCIDQEKPLDDQCEPCQAYSLRRIGEAHDD